MAGKKSSYKFFYDSPVTVTFVLLCAAVFLLDSFTKISLAQKFLVCHAKSKCGSFDAFNFRSALDYVRMFLHIFGSMNFSDLFGNLILALLLGPALEERYGSAILSLMLFISSLVAGVLNACVSTSVLTGSSEIVFTMIILASLTELLKKQVKISWILVFVLFMAFRMYGQGSSVKSAQDFFIKNICTFIQLAGGIAGSLFGFLASPKKRQAVKSSSRKNSDTTVEYKEPSQRNYSYNDDSTVVGSIPL